MNTCKIQDSKERPKSKERVHRSAEKDSKKSKGQSVPLSPHSVSRSRSRSDRKKRERSSTPKPVRIHVGRLTRNVTKDHVHEIFSNYGNILKLLELLISI